ncbi:succinate dehydrogenase, cytochrome b556 subunit [Nitrosospira briensis]|uniref:Succinate dehydrogenase cytochrome b556 subunit n=1 Tax=Nitrosospira briensis TaxID=35799 RepID=A0A1I4XBN7_9PROT|nr:succinate dehydrogenase, cytochrome b556 subunit [Nitrosospira briensis]
MPWTIKTFPLAVNLSSINRLPWVEPLVNPFFSGFTYELTRIVSLDVRVYTRPWRQYPTCPGSEHLQRKRPKYLDLMRIKQPLPAVVSLLHRVSGALLFFPGIPLLLCSLDIVLNSPEGHVQLQSLLDNPLLKVVLTLSLWFFLHHFCAGIRFLALDLHYGSSLQQARTTSKIVFAAGVILTLLISASMW